MRPQLAAMGSLGGAQAAQKIAEDLEDLGWNDMGHEEAEVREAEVLSLTPAPTNPAADAMARADDAQARAELAIITPREAPVRRQQQTVVDIFHNDDDIEHTVEPKDGTDAGRRAAFTLRLDAKRHLKLRLASTVKNRSAQQLVTQALDKFLSEIPEIEALAAQVTRD
jgi:predicted RNA-binding Zn ribbon-like protein